MNKEKTKKVVNIAVTILCAVIFVFAAAVVIASLSSRSKGYVNLFGTAYLTVASDSMNGGREESFKKGDLIAVDILSETEKSSLKVGQVISFFDETIVNGKKLVNTHRIIGKKLSTDGEVMYYTRGDANSSDDLSFRTVEDVIGLYKGKASNVGKALVWLQSKTGNLVCVVLPSILIVLYCIVMVGYNVYVFNKRKLMLAKEEMKQELLKELSESRNNEQNGTDKTDEDDNPEDRG